MGLSLHIRIAPSGPPTNVTAEAISTTELNISWQPPPWLEQNGIITAFKVLILCPDLNISYMHNTTGNMTILTATGIIDGYSSVKA